MWSNSLKFEIAMMKTLLTTALLSSTFLAFGQNARLNLNNDVWMVIDNGSYLVIDNPNTNALATTGTGGNLSSESENDRVRWAIGNSTGLYRLPYTNNAGDKIPFTFQITTAGSANGSMLFSTYNHEVQGGAAWNNDLYRPSDVTHMLDWATGSLNNSANAVDRFWIVDARDATYGYTSAPSSRMTFTYDVATDVTAGNTITGTSQVGAQRFNTVLGQWGDLLPVGSGTGGTLPSVSIPGTDLFRSWTLANVNTPLPIDLARFDAQCTGAEVEIMWTTATEMNNDFFTVEKSDDGLEWLAIGTVPGAINSSQSIDYMIVDPSPSTVAYYRLVQTDLDGTSTTSDIVAAGCEGVSGTQIVNAWDDGNTVTLVVNSSSLENFNLSVTDAQGKELLTRPSQVINEGMTSLSFNKGQLATGVYLLRLHNGEGAMTRRIVLN